jgi:2'-5' RNA ligase
MGLLAVSHPNLKHTDREWIQALRRQYDPNYALVEPHFTLIFEISDIKPDELAAHARPICQATGKIAFNLDSAKVVPGKNEDKHYLFLVPDAGYRDIRTLHDKLYTGMLEKHLRPDIPYIPHITVGVFRNVNDSERILDAVNREKISISGTIENIDIISAGYLFEGQERLETVERISLGL